jgi:hypothetical protein
MPWGEITMAKIKYSSRTSPEPRSVLEHELGLKLSDAQLRGHPGKGELSISVLRLGKSGSTGAKYDYVAREVYKGKSATASRMEVKLSRSAVFLHAEAEGRHSLTYDVLELLRADIDNAILPWAASHTWKRPDFPVTPEGIVRLQPHWRRW